jgi:hypothetical protein
MLIFKELKLKNIPILENNKNFKKKYRYSIKKTDLPLFEEFSLIIVTFQKF